MPVEPAPNLSRGAGGERETVTPDTRADKFGSFERIISILETNGNFNSCNSCKRLVPSRLHEYHELKFPFVSRIEFIRSKPSNCSAHVSGVREAPLPPGPTSSAMESSSAGGGGGGVPLGRRGWRSAVLEAGGCSMAQR